MFFRDLVIYLVCLVWLIFIVRISRFFLIKLVNLYNSRFFLEVFMVRYGELS